MKDSEFHQMLLKGLTRNKKEYNKIPKNLKYTKEEAKRIFGL